LRYSRSAAGFTLVEITVAVAIVGILAGLAITQGLKALERAKQAKAMGDMAYSGGGDTYTLTCLGRDGAPSAGITFATRDAFDLDIVIKDGQFVNQPFTR
jgi:prepilin-type N-terminal cleavage/methylation domain-containing protein